jgi:hypothetical protein
VRNVKLILQRYEGWNDRLSRKLVRWGNGVVEAARVMGSEPVERLPVIARAWQARLDGLLVDQLTATPLRDPVVERDWTWERGMHALYRGQFRLSPLDKQPMSPEPPPHLFAQALIQMRRPEVASQELVVSDQQDSLQVAACGAKLPRSKLRQLAKNAVVREGLVEFQERLGDDLVRMRQTAAAEAEQTEEVVREAERRAEEHEAGLKEQIDSLSREFEQTVQSLNEQATLTEERFRGAEARIRQEIASTNGENADLRHQLEELQRNRDIEVAAKRQELAVAILMTRQNVERLTAQLVSVQTTFTESLTTTDQTHQRQIVMVQGQRDELQAEAGQMSAQLRESSAQVAALRTQLRQTQAVQASQQRQIQQLQNDSGGGGGCIVS